jgi:hypothetical protein
MMFLFASAGNAQYLQDTGSPTFAVTERVPMGYVNVANGDLHIEIPITSIPQRGGQAFVGKIIYDSRIWKIVDNGDGPTWQPTNVGTGSPWGWRYVSTGLEPRNYDSVTNVCTSGGTNYYWYQYNNYRYTDVNGTIRHFPLYYETSNTCHTAGTTTSSGPSLDATGFVMSNDTSGSTVGQPKEVIAQDGTKVYMEAPSGTTKVWQDPKGNFMDKSSSGNPLIDPSGLNNPDTSINVVDTLNRILMEKDPFAKKSKLDHADPFDSAVPRLGPTV